MADNITLSLGTEDGSTLATDEVAGAGSPTEYSHYQIVKLADGTANSSQIIASGNGTSTAALRVTVSSDSTGVLSIDDNGGSITIDNADITTIAGAVSGSEMQVDIVGALPAGTNAIGKLSANSGVDIGDVDVTSVVPGTGATNLGKAEDSAHSSADVGVMALAVRNDELHSLSDDGDYTPLQVNKRGALYTADLGVSGAVDGFGHITTTSPNNQIDIPFYRDTPTALLGTLSSNGTNGSGASSNGGALFSSSTDTNGEILGQTLEKVRYRSGAEVYAVFTAAWLDGGAATSSQHIGLWDGTNGFYMGYDNTTFGLTVETGGTPGTPTTAWSEDPLDGSAGSAFTRDGTAEAIDYTKLNVFRIRYGWLGSAVVHWEVMAPDGHFVTFHKTLFPNLQATPSIQDSDLPIRLHIVKTAGAGNLRMQTDCWGAGVVAGDQMADEDYYAFQTTATLNNGASYDSGVLALSPMHSQVQTSVEADQDGTITINWFTDAAGSNNVRVLTIPYTASDNFQMFAAPAFTPFVQYIFANDSGSNQTDFHFDTKFLRRAINPQLLRVDGPVVGGMVASVSRSLITASNGSNYVNIAATAGGNLKMSLQEISDGSIDIGAGNAGTETQRVSISTDDVNLSAIKTAIEILDDWDESDRAKVNLIAGQAGIAGGTGVDGATVPRVTLATDVGLPAGTNAIGKLAANSGVDIGDVDVTSISAGTNLIGDVGISGARTSGGTSIFSSIDLDESAEQVKGSAGQIYWIHAMNLATAVRYLKVYNSTAASVGGSPALTPAMTFPLPTQGDANGAGFVFSVPNGIAFDNAITVEATTGIGVGDTGAPGANEVIVNIGYA